MLFDMHLTFLLFVHFPLFLFKEDIFHYQVNSKDQNMSWNLYTKRNIRMIQYLCGPRELYFKKTLSGIIQQGNWEQLSQ